uniref:Ribosomal protein n=1 Tax=Amorphochlora amoebiformis TaxID=1561963 RepID=A0A7S0H3Q8_9EUKA|mmetsp:Transcript_31907/g.51311  ORF Transcript_31907/g.51311 Transcript_31907/m.51311 type:complete len:221 (+) Transcript_31907:36-698(+)
MSKINSDALSTAIEEIKKHAEEKKRNFLETVELQIALKNYDPSRDKRFSGAIALPSCPRKTFTICIIGNEKHLGEAKELGVDFQSVDDVKKLKKNKKLVKKMAKKYDAFLASSTLIKKLPRLMGPGLSKAGKFPTAITNNESMNSKIEELKSTIKFALKNKKTLCMGVPVGQVNMSEEELRVNIVMAVNKLVSLLKKNWQNVKRLYLKSTMGPSHRIYGF